MRLAVFTKNRTNPAYAAARLGAERAAAAWGAAVQHYVPDTPDDAEEQSALIDRALALRPDAIVFSPVHPTRVDAAIRRVAAVGIPIVGFINPIAAAPTVSYVGADDVRLGRELGHYLFRHMRGHGRVLLVAGHEFSITSQDRLRGFMEAAADHPGIEIAGRIAGDYARTVASRRAAEWTRLKGCPEGCLAANDAMALGVLEALDDARCSCPVVGVNAIPEAIAAIAQGLMLATADFNAMQMAFLATQRDSAPARRARAARDRPAGADR
jgi:ribose transport system substrate-binding protein